MTHSFGNSGLFFFNTFFNFLIEVFPNKMDYTRPAPGGMVTGAQGGSAMAPMPSTTYICGGTLSQFNPLLLPILILWHVIDCGIENELKIKDAIRCRECGYRIMYKKRTQRSTFPPTRVMFLIY